MLKEWVTTYSAGFYGKFKRGDFTYPKKQQIRKQVFWTEASMVPMCLRDDTTVMGRELSTEGRKQKRIFCF